jgi:tetratricopeptide (TPR) repeat protein
MTNRPIILFTALAAASIAAATPNCTAQQGQTYIDSGQYNKAIQEFTCLIDAQPTEPEGYRGRTEAELLLGQFSNAVRDYVRVYAYVLPAHPDAEKLILATYDAQLAANPNDTRALTGASFTRWWFFDYRQAIHLLKQLLAIAPDDLYGNLFMGSNRMLSGVQADDGAADLERAISMAPASPDVHYIVADAYTYGQFNPNRAFNEASIALNWGLDTPRIHGILADCYLAFGNLPAAGMQLLIHLSQVTTQLVQTAPLAAGTSLSLPLVPGRTYEIPVVVSAGQTLAVTTSSKDFWDTILVLLAPDGSPITGSDDVTKYFAALNWVATASGTYKVRVSSFESVNTGELVVTRK